MEEDEQHFHTPDAQPHSCQGVQTNNLNRGRATSSTIAAMTAGCASISPGRDIRPKQELRESWLLPP